MGIHLGTYMSTGIFNSRHTEGKNIYLILEQRNNVQ